jgi:hypothetical protein
MRAFYFDIYNQLQIAPFVVLLTHAVWVELAHGLLLVQVVQEVLPAAVVIVLPEQVLQLLLPVSF